MFRKSGYRFSDKDMRKRNNPERIPLQSKRDALAWRSRTCTDERPPKNESL
jgi:hypothetical protein